MYAVRATKAVQADQACGMLLPMPLSYVLSCWASEIFLQYRQTSILE